MSLDSKIREYMSQNVEDHTDRFSDVNTTSLAEDCAHNMEGGSDSWLDDELHVVWEIASEFYPEDRLP